MKPLPFFIVGSIAVLAVAIVVGMFEGQAETIVEKPVGKAAAPLVLRAHTVWMPQERIAVDLELNPGEDGKVIRYVLWSDGTITTTVGTRSYWPVPPPSDCPADINGDGMVGVPDMLILQAAWGTDCP